MQENYKNYQIFTEGFKKFDDRDGIIARIRVRSDSGETLLVYALSGINYLYFQNNKIDPLDTALEDAKKRIDESLTKTPYYFELQDGQVYEVENPEWWVASR